MSLFGDLKIVEPFGHDLGYILILDSDKLSFESDLIGLLHFANRETSEVLQKVIIAHPEGVAVVILVKFGLEQFLDIRSPEGGLARPGSIPFEVTPQISDVYEFM